MTDLLASRIPAPRLLPVTIALLAAVLAAKSIAIVRGVAAGTPPDALIAGAWASGQETAGHDTGGPRDTPAANRPARAEAPKAGGVTPEPAPAATPSEPPGPPPITESEKKILLDLRARRQLLEEREAALATRETAMGAAERRLAARVDELKDLQQRLETLDGARREQQENAWRGLVKVYEAMKPRDAAAICNDLGMPVLMAMIERMKEAKASAILAAMAPDKARDVTTELARTRTRAARAIETGGGAAPPPSQGAGPGT